MQNAKRAARLGSAFWAGLILLAAGCASPAPTPAEPIAPVPMAVIGAEIALPVDLTETERFALWAAGQDFYFLLYAHPECAAGAQEALAVADPAAWPLCLQPEIARQAKLWSEVSARDAAPFIREALAQALSWLRPGSTERRVSADLEFSQGGAVEARRAHNPEVVGSSPAPATSFAHDIARLRENTNGPAGDGLQASLYPAGLPLASFSLAGRSR